MNEATFEARLHAELRNLFPTLESQRITHQKVFNLRLGHHEVIVDGTPKEKAGGRLDVLVLIDEVPAVLFELKGPIVPINPEDMRKIILQQREKLSRFSLQFYRWI